MNNYDCEDGITRVNKHLATGIIKIQGLKKGSNEFIIFCKNGKQIKFYSANDCDPVGLESQCITRGTDIYTNCDWCKLEVISKWNEVWEGYEYNPVRTFYNLETNFGEDYLAWFYKSDGFVPKIVDIAII